MSEFGNAGMEWKAPTARRHPKPSPRFQEANILKAEGSIHCWNGTLALATRSLGNKKDEDDTPVLDSRGLRSSILRSGDRGPRIEGKNACECAGLTGIGLLSILKPTSGRLVLLGGGVIA